ncbi:hypothetical protein PIB30_022116 [Stylosanthes scabra]|uniref:Pentatricopeptide repeat-containing protein n=1 Tax=Stylosanthes scabra TaxID=79078 RepID=A0ABU6TB35_9FABA|nr:hypothetical protein [Stylosanthes scabra]
MSTTTTTSDAAAVPSETQLLKTVTTILTSHEDPLGALKPLIPKLSLPTVVSVFSSTQLHRTHSAALLSFFHILHNSPHFSISSSPEPLLAIFPPLLVHRRYSSARSLLCSFISSDHPCHSLHQLLLHRPRLPQPLLDTSLSTYALSDHSDLAFQLFNKMKRLRIKPNLLTCRSLLSSLVRHHPQSSHSINLSKQVFNDFIKLGITPNTTTFNILIHGSCLHNNFNDALTFMNQMTDFACSPDNVTYNTILDALCRKGQLTKVREVLLEMKGSAVSPNRNTYNILVHGYCRLRWLKEAAKVVELMRANSMVPDIWTYNTIVRGLCDEGKVKEAIRLRAEMESLRVMPDEVTYNTPIDGSFQWRGSAEVFELVEEMRKGESS